MYNNLFLMALFFQFVSLFLKSSFLQILIFSSPARSAQSYCCYLGRPRLRLRVRPRHTFG